MQFFAHHLRQPLGPRQDVGEIDDQRQQFLVLGDDLVLFESREAVQAHVEDGLGLDLGEPVAACPRRCPNSALTVCGRVLIEPARASICGTAPEVHTRPMRPTLASTDDGDALMSAITSSMLASATARPSRMWARSRALAQVVNRAARDDLAAVAQECSSISLSDEQLRLAVDERHHVDAEHGLERRLREEVVEHHFGDFAALELDDDAHAVLVGLVAQVGDAVDFLVARQLGDALDQPRLVHLVRQFGDDDGLAPPALSMSSKCVRARIDRRPRPVR